MPDDPREPLICEFYRKLLTLTEALRDALHQSYPAEDAFKAQIAHEIALLCAHVQRRSRQLSAVQAAELSLLESIYKLK